MDKHNRDLLLNNMDIMRQALRKQEEDHISREALLKDLGIAKEDRDGYKKALQEVQFWLTLLKLFHSLLKINHIRYSCPLQF